MTKQLRIYRDCVALEAIAVHDVSEYFKGIFPAVANSFRNFITEVRPSDAAVALSPSYKTFLKDLPKHHYTDVMPLIAYIPEGLNTDYLEYAEALLSAAEHASKIMDVLNPYSVYLSQLITNPEMKLATTSKEKEFKVLEQARDKLNAQLGACFKKGSTRAESSYGEVIKRNSDWDDVFGRVEAITRNIYSVDRKKVINKINECSDHLDVILKMVNGGKMESVANQTVTNLADGAYQMACELEFFTVIYFKTEVFVACVNKTLDHFKKCTEIR
jgi:hypothetical protein